MFHYVLTVQAASVRDVTNTVTVRGLIDPADHEYSREEILSHLIQEARTQWTKERTFGGVPKFVVMFFSLEPNDFPRPRSRQM